MKRTIHLLIVLCVSIAGNSQTFLERTAERTKEKIKQRAENQVDKGIDKALDKTESEIENAVKGNKKSDRDTPSTSNSSVDKNQGETSASSVNNPKNLGSNPSMKAYSKFDFISGEKVIAYEDFLQDAIGDFPAKWNTNSSGEVVTFDQTEGHWFLFQKKGVYYPEFINQLPNNFTLEFDLVLSEEFSEMQSGLKLYFVDSKDRNLKFDQYFNTSPQAGVDIHPVGSTGSSDIWVCDKSNEQIMENSIRITWNVGKVNRISIWRQQNRLRVYVNETKIWDLPRAFLADINYSMLFATNIWEGEIYMSNMRLAEGNPDTRNKLLTDGKIVSRGILFDVNSDRIKPESYGTLQDIAKTLKEVPDVRVRIVGHTDSDGDDMNNLELSKKRAQAVKQILISEFSVNGSSLETEGKGESEPIDSNSTSAGKANNRRVEFIKM